MTRPISFLLLIFFVVVQSTVLAFAEPITISWEVENRFRFYRDAAVFRHYAAVAQAELASGRKDWILATERKLQEYYYLDAKRGQLFPGVKRPDADNDWNGWASLTREQTCRDRHGFDLTRFSECADYVVPVSHTVLANVQGAAPGGLCRWDIVPSGEPLSADKSLWRRRDAKTNKSLKDVQLPCNQTVRIEVPWAADRSGSVDVTVTAVSGGNSVSSAPEKIQVMDILVAGMGDSFAAGVGNPDKPAQMDWRTGIRFDPIAFGANRGGILPVRLGGYNDQVVPTGAVYAAQSEWQDIRCFRSQYGPQFRAALHLGILMKHAAVTYLDMSCNGARIIEGLLSRKLIDRGYSTNTPKPVSQIGLVSRLLCADRNSVERISYKMRPARVAEDCNNLGKREICEFSKEQGRIEKKYQNDPGITNTTMTVCSKKGSNPFSRDVDVLLLSIGGNDIGFAPMVADVIIDDERAVNSVIKKLGTLVGAIHSGSVGMERLNLLKSKYDVLDKAIAEFIPLRAGSKKPIFLSAYPLPVDSASGAFCGAGSDSIEPTNAALDINPVFSDFGAPKKKYGRARAPLVRLLDVAKTSCALNLRRFAWFDGGSGANAIVNEMTKTGAPCAGQQELAKPRAGESNLGWQFVPEAILTFRGHGFCALNSNETALLDLSIPTFHSGADKPWDPHYLRARPYAPRQRWIRTPNDAYVVTNWQTGAARLNDFTNLMAAATTTAMHPTAEGYAAMADGLLERVGSFLCSERKTEIGEEPLCRPQ